MRTITHHQGAHSNALSRALAVETADGRGYLIGSQTLTFSERPVKGPSPVSPDGISDEALIAVLEDRAAALVEATRKIDDGYRANLVLQHLRYAREWLEGLTREPLPKPPPAPKPDAAALSFKSPAAIAAGLVPKAQFKPEDETEAIPGDAAASLRAMAAAPLPPLPTPVTAPAPAVVFPAT